MWETRASRINFETSGIVSLFAKAYGCVKVCIESIAAGSQRWHDRGIIMKHLDLRLEVLARIFTEVVGSGIFERKSATSPQ
jgi:hypothetical protein